MVASFLNALQFGGIIADSRNPMLRATMIWLSASEGSRQKTAVGSEKNPATGRALETPQPYRALTSWWVRYVTIVLAFGTAKTISCTGPTVSTTSGGFGWGSAA